jgi:hypothetical protein
MRPSIERANIEHVQRVCHVSLRASVQGVSYLVLLGSGALLFLAGLVGLLVLLGRSKVSNLCVDSHRGTGD